jgi:hypothetical protein
MAVVVKSESAGYSAPIYVEVESAVAADGLGAIYDDQTREKAAEKVLAIARDVYGDGLDLARRCAEQAASRFRGLGEGVKPDEAELQLAIKLDAGLGAALVKSGAEAQLQVTFRWDLTKATDAS